jgi:GNAT superfamily N-acetyltransferase
MHEFDSSEVRIVPANAASWEDLQTILGPADYAHYCQCQRQRWRGRLWWDMPFEERAERFRDQTACGNPDASETSGIVAYLGDEPVGWCSVEPRTAFGKLLTSRVPWSGREEDRADAGVWAVACFIVRRGFRGTGLTYALARGAVEHARSRGATALEGYPMITSPGKEITWGELNVGPLGAFLDAGFREVTHPTPRRVVVRIDF